ncbi:MAG TPA: sensor histidine kinase [Chitinophagaceae bacterium]|jgi:signal transduction histidine kinase|nr:sensor histidine kinase [Chitinophagaceae bacterium]HMU59857.1 sensor histidine kinase [Chitinophagaceae bacterium]
MKKYKLIIGFIAALLISSRLPAQQEIADSLTTLLSKTTAENERGRLHIKIAKEYISFDTVKARDHLQKGLALADKSGDNMGSGMYHLYTSYLLCNKGMYKEGLAAFEKAAGYFTKFISDKKITRAEKAAAEALLLDAELSQGNVYLELYDYEKALSVFWKVLKLSEQTDFPEKDAAIAVTYQSIALAYYHRAQYQTALQYYLTAVPYAQKSGNQRMAAESNIYAAMCYTLVRKYDSSALLLHRAEPVVLQSADAVLKTSFFARRAELYRFTEKWQDAVDNYDTAIQYAKATSNIYMQATFAHAKARCLLKLQRITEARKEGMKALELARSIDKKREILESQKVLSMVEAAAGDYAAAYAYSEQYNTGNDSLHATDLTEKIQLLDKKYQSALQEEKIGQLEKDKKMQELISRKRQTINYILSFSVLALLVTGLLAIRNHLQKQKLQQHRINELETEKKLMATEAVLKGEEQERTRLAKDLHDGLGGMLSGIKYSLNTMKGNLIMTPENAQGFERSIDMLDSSIKEMRRVAHNMMPEVLLRYGLDAALKDYTTEINNSGIIKIIYQSMGTEKKGLEQSSLLALYRIVQELISNAIKHAAASEVLVQIFWESGKLVVNVEDNGTGFDPSILDIAEGIGWKNIRSRVELLKGKADILSHPGKGTAVNIEFIHL